jgi:NAD-dependent deacetylase
MKHLIEKMDSIIRSSKRIVFFGGAGVSMESGIPDFRSQDGLYNQQYQDPPEEILSHSYFISRTEDFFRFYRDKMLYPAARPNDAHRVLARMERAGMLTAVITQNIDGLHQAAGSKNVIELHGTTLHNTCMRCGKRYGLSDILPMDNVPLCTCGGVIKPDVTLYEEALPDVAMEAASHFVDCADLMIVGGTSLSVYPAAGFARWFPGHLVIINKTPTPMDAQADLCIPHPIGRVFAAWEEMHFGPPA